MTKFILNGKKIVTKSSNETRLLDVLREELGLVGTKEGCSEGECGACAILVDGKLVNSCLVAVGSIEGCEVMTIEGFRETERFKVIDKAYAKMGAIQCGICIPGMVMATEALLSQNSNPTEEEIRVGLSGNLCRCTGYNIIVDAVKLAAKEGKGLW